MTDEEIDRLPSINDDELDALPSLNPKKPAPSGVDKAKKVAVDTVTGVVGAPVDMFTLAMKVADMKNELAAKVGNMVLGTVGLGEPLGAIDTIEEVNKYDGKEPDAPLPLSGEWLRESLPEDMRGAPAETPIGRAVQEVATFAGQNVLGMGLGGASRVARGLDAGVTTAGLARAAKNAVVPALASSTAGEVDDSLRFPAVVAAELVRGGAGAARRHMAGTKRVLAEGGRTTREASLEARGRRAAGEMVTEALGDDALDQLDEGIRARDAIRQRAPGFNPTTAAVTNNQKLAATERAMDSGLHGQQSGAAILPDAKNDFFVQRRESNRAVSDAVDRLLSPQGGNPADLHAFAQRQLDAAEAAHRAAVNALDYTPTPSGAPEELGERVRQYVIDNHQRGREQASRLYNAHLDAYGTEPVSGVGRLIDVLDSERTLDPQIAQRLQNHQQALAAKRAEHIDPLLDTMYSTFRREIDNAVEARITTEGLTDDAAAAARPIYRQEATEAMQIPYAHAVRYHQQLGAAANDARVAGASDKARRLERAQEALREVMDTGVANPDLQQGLRLANAFYRDFINRFSVKGQPGMHARGRKPNSPDAPLVNSGGLVAKMFVKGEEGFDVAEQTARALQTLDENTGAWVTDQERLRDLQNAVFDRAVRAAYDRGSVAKGTRPRLPSDNLAKWLEDHQDALRHPIFAPVRNRLTSLRTMRESLERQAAQSGADADEIRRTVLAKMLGLDNRKAVSAFLNASPQARQQTMQMLQGEADAQRALREMVLDHFAMDSISTSEALGYDHRTLRADALLKKLEQNSAALTGVFDPDHLRDARTMLKALSKMESARVDPTRGSQTTPLKSYQDALLKGDSSTTMLGGQGRHLLSLGFGMLGTQMAGRTAGALMSMGAGVAAGAASELAMGRISRMRDVSRAATLRWMKEAISDPEQARVAVRFLRGEPAAIPLVRNYLWASGDLASRSEPRGSNWSEEDAAYPSAAFDDELVVDFGRFSNPAPAPPPRNQAQVKGAETKRAEAAKRVVKTARSASMNPPKVAREMRQKGLSVADIQKKSEASRRKPFEDLVERNSGDLQRLLAVVEALKSDERELVRDLAKPAIDKLIEAERDDLTAAEAMARADELFAPPPAEEGASAAV